MGIGTSPTYTLSSKWLLLAGSPLVLFWLLADTPIPLFEPTKEALSSAYYNETRLAGALGLIMVALSLIKLYDTIESASERLAFFGFVLVMTSVTFLAGSLFQQVITESGTMQVRVEGKLAKALAKVWTLIHVLGNLLFSIALIQARKSFRIPVAFIFAGALMFSITGALCVFPPIIGMAGAMLWLAGILWVSLYRDNS